ncbi:hypothetical protein C1J01_40885 [Nonomuraea aridisoli]|uniref:MmyB-like transcription regulator ligand binding domain-containing protein n=2 Tax=Nonomuraea aridisoli TaxID=2070368 RepID=A0A2W2EDB5_9ACTN|nr:hypothetical protein C1J01_40885 [Nonomuraea aridisoli]
MLRLMKSLDGLPAILFGRRTDIIAATPTVRLLFPECYALPAGERNAARWMLTSRQAREICLNWEEAVTGAVGMLRLHAGRHPDDPRTSGLLQELGESPDFTQIWDECHVAARMVREWKTVEHPVVGRIRFHAEAVASPDDPDQVLQVFMPASDAASESAMRELRRLAEAERTAPGRR